MGIDARLISGPVAGIGFYLHYLAKYLKESQRVRITVYDDARFASEKDFAQWQNRGLRKIAYILWLNTRFPAILKEDKVDLIHAPNFIPPLWRGPVSVATFHDLGFLRYPHTHQGLYAVLFPSLVNRAVDRVKFIITPSESSRDEVLYYYPRAKNKVRVIYEAAGGNFKVINDAEYLQNIRTKFHLPEHFLLCVGTLEPRKNLERFFTAFNLFINKYPRSDLKLVLCGKTWLRHRDFLRSLQTSGIAHKVLMLGYVTGEDLAGIYNCALALAFPSYYEGFGLPAVEAMQCGLPVIASNAFSLPEILQDAALYFDPFDIDEMALAIELISSDPDEREHLRERGLLRAKFFSWEKTAKETEEIYYEALD